MKAEIGKARAANGRGALRQLFVAVTGIVVITLAVAAGYASGHKTRTVEASEPRVVYRMLTGVTAPQPQYVFYLVSSDQERTRYEKSLDGAATDRAVNGVPDPETKFFVLLAGTPSEAQNAWQTIAGWVDKAKGTSVDITVNDVREK